MLRANSDVRSHAKEAGVFLYQIADAIGVSEPTIIRKLRYELSKEEKEKYFGIIDSIKEQQKAGASA